MRLQSAIFDMDGTLLDSMPYYSIFVGVWVDGKIVSLDIIFFYT